MKYYLIDVSSEKEITGSVYPQLAIHKMDSENNIQELSNSLSFERTNSEYKLEYHAKETDFMSIDVEPYFVMNQEARYLFEQFNIRDSFFIDISVLNCEGNYSLIYFPFNEKSIDLINFSKSTFKVTDLLSFDDEIYQKNVQFNSDSVSPLVQWKSKCLELGLEKRLVPERIVLSENAIGADILYLSPFCHGGIFVSERLKHEIENRRFSGLNFYSPEYITG